MLTEFSTWKSQKKIDKLKTPVTGVRQSKSTKFRWKYRRHRLPDFLRRRMRDFPWNSLKVILFRPKDIRRSNSSSKFPGNPRLRSSPASAGALLRRSWRNFAWKSLLNCIVPSSWISSWNFKLNLTSVSLNSLTSMMKLPGIILDRLVELDFKLNFKLKFPKKKSPWNIRWPSVKKLRPKYPQICVERGI